MKKTILILLFIAAAFAAKQSSAQVRPSVVKTPVLRPSVTVKSFGIVNHHVSPPLPARLGLEKLMYNQQSPIIIHNSDDGSTSASTTHTNSNGSYTTNSTTYNPDGSIRSTTTTTYNPDGSIRSTNTDTNPTGAPPTLTDNDDGTTTATVTQAINKNYSDERLPPPVSYWVSQTQLLKIIFVWSGA